METRWQGISADDPQVVSSLVAGPDEIVRRELAEIVPVIAATLSEQLSAGACSFYIYNRDATRTVAAFRHGEAQLLFPDEKNVDLLPPFQIPAEAEMMRTGEPIARSTDADFERWPLFNTNVRDQTEQYVDVLVPLRRNGVSYGVVYLWRHGDPGPFTDAEVENAQDLAQIAAMAVEFARQYGDERARRQSLNALLDVASLAASHLTVDEVMPAVARIVRSVTDADVCNLYVFDDSRNRVESAFSDGLNERERWVFDGSDTYPVSNVPAEERAKATLAPVLVRDPESDLADGSELIQYTREVRISEILIVPIVYQETMTGVIYLWYRDADRSFREQAKSTAQGIANQAGGVVSQARLYDESRQHMSEIEALRQIGEAVLHSDSLNSVLDQIADVLSRMIPYDFSFIGMVSEDHKDVVVRRIWGNFPPGLLNYRIPIEQSVTGLAVRTRAVVNRGEVMQDQQMHRYNPQHLPIRSVLVSPLLTEDKTVGVLYIGCTEPNLFSARQERLMMLLSQQAAAAIERTQARESLAQHAQRQTFLATVTSHLIAADEPTDALQEIAQAGCGVLADGVAIAVSSWEYGKLRWAGAAHLDQKAGDVLRQTLFDADGVTHSDRVELILASDQSHRLPIANGSPSNGQELEPAAVEMLQAIGAVEILTVPMRQHGRAPGLMVLYCTTPGSSLSSDAEAMAQMVANRIGDALERSQMVHNREGLLRLSEAINTHAEIDQLLDIFIRELQEIVPYDQLFLGKLDPESGQTRPLKFVNPLDLDQQDVELASNKGISGEVIQTGKALIDNQAHLRESSIYASEIEKAYYARNGESAMATPLIAEDTVIGVLFIGRTGANRFSDSDFETFLLFSGMAASAIHRTELMQSNRQMYRASVEVLAAVVDAKDPTTLQHSRSVARYARMLAGQAGLGPADIEQVELAGLLHDIGKLSIPDHVLSKPGPLTAAERALINTHPERGARILSQHPALSSLIPVVRHHHERVDGTGYPDGLKGDQIPFGASIICVADAFDTMISLRTYQQRISVEDALEELERNAGSQFHPQLVELFVSAIRDNPELVGSSMNRLRTPVLQKNTTRTEWWNRTD